MASTLLQQRLENAGIEAGDVRGRLFTAQTEQPSDFSLGKTIANIPASGARLVGDIIGLISKPIQTFEGLSDVIVGTISRAIPGEAKAPKLVEAEQSSRQIQEFFKDRYGSVESIQQTIQEDPVGVAADIAAILTGVGGAVRGGATAASKVAGVSRATQVAGRDGRAIQRAGTTIEPISLGIRATERITRPVRRIAKKTVGVTGEVALGVTTGTSPETIRQAFLNPGQEFKQALRGITTEENLLTTAREGLNKLKDQRADAYLKSFKKLKGLDKTIDRLPLRRFIIEQLEKFNIVRKTDGQLNFNRSTIADVAEQKRIGAVVEETLRWQDFTPKGLDILKRRLDDFFTPSKQGRALTNSIRNEVKNTVVKNVDGYGQLTREYAEASALIDEIETSLSLKAGASLDTTIKKLTSSLRTSQPFRRELVRKLDDITKRNIAAEIAGLQLSEFIPQGLIGRGSFAAAGGIFLSSVGLGTLPINVLLSLASTSPRIVGEFLRVLGLSRMHINNFLQFTKESGLRDLAKKINIALEQAGKTTDLGLREVPPETVSLSNNLPQKRQ